MLKSHHRNWTKQPSDFDQTQWLLNHTALLNEQKALWEDNGYEVRTERQNSFQLRGRTALLDGRSDLIVVRADDALIIDVKAGQEQPWHSVQIMIYQYALPKASTLYSYARLPGEVVYPTRIVRVHRDALPGQFIDNLGPRSAGSPPRTRPSACRAHKSAASATSASQIARNEWTKAQGPVKESPKISDHSDRYNRSRGKTLTSHENLPIDCYFDTMTSPAKPDAAGSGTSEPTIPSPISTSFQQR